MVSDYTSTIKLALVLFFYVKSLQALNNGGWRMKKKASSSLCVCFVRSEKNRT